MNPLLDMALNDMVDLVRESHIPCGIYNFLNIPIEISNELEKITGQKSSLTDILNEDSLSIASKHLDRVGNVTLTSVELIGTVYYIDIYFFGRNNKQYYLATFRDSRYSVLEKHFRTAALVQSNLQMTSDIIQDIAMASNGYIKSVSDEKISNDVLWHIHMCSYRLMRYHTDIKLLCDMIFDIHPTKYSILDPVRLIKSIISGYKETHAESNAKFTLKCAEKDLSVYCDRQMITRAISNIFANMLLLTSAKKPEISINIDQILQDYTRIAIHCNKLKLTQKEIDMLMTGDFKSAQKRTTYDGLYITNSILIQHKGIFDIKTHEEKGTVFLIGLFDNVVKMKFKDYENPDDGDILHDIIISEFLT